MLVQVELDLDTLKQNFKFEPFGYKYMFRDDFPLKVTGSQQRLVFSQVGGYFTPITWSKKNYN
jgi:hypothetical protein